MNGELERAELDCESGFTEEAFSESTEATPDNLEDLPDGSAPNALENDYIESYTEQNLPESDITNEDSEVEPVPEVDYGELMLRDLAELKEEFAELHSLESVAQLNNPLRYAALRDMGLSPREAYLATSVRPRRTDNRSHLKRSVPTGAKGRGNGMTRSELMYARELFSGMSDADIYSLYKRVSN